VIYVIPVVKEKQAERAASEEASKGGDQKADASAKR